MARTRPDAGTVGEVLAMALSDHVSFDQIRALHGWGPDEVQGLMRHELRLGSYVAWRKRVRQFTDRREFYK
ncbi:TIGR03643 family protein [Malikia spinosa]|uniref:TIGR03643 family protein n=2 Tax=Malikia spinosa TaxID=86180 RepID=A0A2S9KA19_9BURK|nr:TIGR03643 family protein [Malikia spinosa]